MLDEKTEEEKFYVHKYSGHYYTENRLKMFFIKWVNRIKYEKNLREEMRIYANGKKDGRLEIKKELEKSKNYIEQLLRIISAECEPDVIYNPVNKRILKEIDEFLEKNNG